MLWGKGSCVYKSLTGIPIHRISTPKGTTPLAYMGPLLHPVPNLSDTSTFDALEGVT